MLFDQDIGIPEGLQGEALLVEIMPERVRYNLRVRASDVAAVKKVSGLKLPAKIGACHSKDGWLIMKLGPDEWVITSDPKEAKPLAKIMAKLSKDFVLSATDISHRNIAFVVSGPMARRAVNVGCPLDLSLEAFTVGKVTRTIFESAPIQLYRAGENAFHIECWRSFAPYLRDFFVAFSRDL